MKKLFLFSKNNKRKIDANFKKSVIWNTLGSSFNSFNSLFFLMIVTRVNGLNDAGIFTLAYASSCMFYIIGVYSGRTYQVTETDKDINDNEYIFNRLITSIFMIFISLLFGVINNYHGNKMIVFILLCISKSIEAICDVFHGILQKRERLDIVGKSLFIRSLFGLILFFIIDVITENEVFACISLIIINLIVLYFIDIKYGKKYKIKDQKVNFISAIKILSYGFYSFGFLFIANYLVNAPRYAIDSLLESNMQTIFGIIVMPASIIMLISQFIIQPIITKLKEEYAKRNKREFLKLIYKVVGLTSLAGFISIVFAKLFGALALEILFGLELKKYIPSLLLILIGATVYTISTVLSNAMIVLRRTKLQLYIYLVTATFAFLISYKLVGAIGFNGAIYSYLITMIILLSLYIIAFLKILIIDKIFEV